MQLKSLSRENFSFHSRCVHYIAILMSTYLVRYITWHWNHDWFIKYILHFLFLLFEIISHFSWSQMSRASSGNLQFTANYAGMSPGQIHAIFSNFSPLYSTMHCVQSRNANVIATLLSTSYTTYFPWMSVIFKCNKT